MLPDPRSLVGCVTLARAVRDLAREGLLLSNGLFVLPSKPALHLNRPVGGEVMDSRLVARRFGTNLRSARRVADYSQEELGLLASLHRTEIGLLERGARCPRIDTLLKLTGSLEVPTDELLGG